MKEGARERGIDLTDRAALRRMLEWTIGQALAEQGKSARTIKSTIDRELKNQERRLREARNPRPRKRRK